MEIGKFGLLTILVVVLFGLGGFFGYSQINALNIRVTSLEGRIGPAEATGKQAVTGLLQVKPYLDMTAATANKAAKDAAEANDTAAKALAAATEAKDAADKGGKRK